MCGLESSFTSVNIKSEIQGTVSRMMKQEKKFHIKIKSPKVQKFSLLIPVVCRFKHQLMEVAFNKQQNVWKCCKKDRDFL